MQRQNQIGRLVVCAMVCGLASVGVAEASFPLSLSPGTAPQNVTPPVGQQARLTGASVPAGGGSSRLDVTIDSVNVFSTTLSGSGPTEIELDIVAPFPQVLAVQATGLGPSAPEITAFGVVENIPPPPPTDEDSDGVDDFDDQCPGTAAGALVDGAGCSGAQQTARICPCESTWKNHGKYVSCVAHATELLADIGLLTDDQRDALVSEAGQSSCGKKQ